LGYAQLVILKAPIDPEALPATPGAYLLELVLDYVTELDIGALGRARLGPGRLGYAGSARGPGGLRSRIGRHLQTIGRRDRWHIDSLTRVVPVKRIIIYPDGNECAVVDELIAAGWQVPVPGFGSSDCRRCPAHLLSAPQSY
jgi:Uri superfamily endonuclease